MYLLTFNALITQTCITLWDVCIKKNLEYFIFRQDTEKASLIPVSSQPLNREYMYMYVMTLARSNQDTANFCKS
jgi:hypothetical protein